MKVYSLDDFTDNEIALGKSYIKQAMLGFINVTIDDQVNKLFEKLGRTCFYGSDGLKLTFTLDTLGNDFLAALGAARNSLKK